MQVHEMILVLQAFERGKEIESRVIRSGSNWAIVTTPSWNFTMYEYRIKQTTYHIGQRFKLKSDIGREGEYLLAQVGGGKIALINLNSGNYWAIAVDCKLASEITQAEFDKACGSEAGCFKEVTE